MDYIDQSQKVTHRVWSFSKPKSLAELSKCQVLCYHCHKKKTRAFLRSPIEHGLEGRYRKGCHCRMCRASHAIRGRLRRLRVTGKTISIL